MNSWKLNSISNNLLRSAISRELQIPLDSVYKIVKNIDTYSEIIETKSGNRYILTLKPVK
jgi:hypothetical protein